MRFLITGGTIRAGRAILFLGRIREIAACQELVEWQEPVVPAASSASDGHSEAGRLF
jgi:hypothetical protein